MQFLMESQKLHFKDEKERLEETFGEFVSFPTVHGKTRVEVKGKTSKGNDYTLRCYLSNDFPNSMPELVVCQPDEPLEDRNGDELNLSYENHCLGFDKYGLTMICHCRQDRWDKQVMNLAQVFIKGFIWLEAYDIMMATGKSMSILPEMPMSDNLEKMQKALIRQRIQIAQVPEDFVNQLMLQFNCQSVEELLGIFLIAALSIAQDQ